VAVDHRREQAAVVAECVAQDHVLPEQARGRNRESGGSGDRPPRRAPLRAPLLRRIDERRDSPFRSSDEHRARHAAGEMIVDARPLGVVEHAERVEFGLLVDVVHAKSC
jgi:hypothetical protein